MNFRNVLIPPLFLALLAIPYQAKASLCHHDCAFGGGGHARISSQGPAVCNGGVAGSFTCNNVDLSSWLSIDDIGGGIGNDCWGWTDPLTGSEYAIVGRSSGTSFVDISVPTSPVYLGDLPAHDASSDWRDMKVYADHVFVVSESSAHGMQVFDLTQLRSVVAPPVTFTETAHFAGFTHAHNIAVNEATGYVYVVGSDQCSGGLYMIDVSSPSTPVFAGCYDGDGYTHDVQCVVYAGPDSAHLGDEICFAANEDSLSIVDLSSKAAPLMLSRTDYAGRSYTHQAWLTEDHAHLLLGDELDELDNGHRTRTYVVDISDLEAPVFTGIYTSHLRAIDHNLYNVGGYSFQANYTAGLRILDLSAIASGALCEVASFDVHPTSDALDFDGAWSSYPFFASGSVIVSAAAGLAVLQPHHSGAPCIVLPPLVQAKAQRNCINAMNKGGAKVAKAQGKENGGCVKLAGKGAVADAQACLSADARGKVQRFRDKLAASELRKCDALNLPDFGYTNASIVGTAASRQAQALVADLFGVDLASAIILASDDAQGASCQANVARFTDRVLQTQIKEFVGCKKAGLKNETIGAATGLEACVVSVAIDARGKLSQAQAKLAAIVSSRCAGVNLAAAFPGACAVSGNLATCAAERSACQFCLMLNAMDSLAEDCDLYDDALANGSCF